MSELPKSIIDKIDEFYKEIKQYIPTPVGEVKRTDDLGRVVIPKKIRKQLDIQDGEALEFFVYNDSILIKKHKEEE